MIIRGIDFARHTVVVGNDSESPAPQAPGQPALQARGDLAARVIASSGGEATLEINGQRVVVETHVPLNVGDKLFVRIQAPEVEGQAIRLQILANEPDQGEPPSAALKGQEVDTLLDDLDVPIEPRSRQAARALLARDGSLDKANLQSLMKDLRTLPRVTQREAGAAALLQKAGVPVNATTVAVMTARAEPEAPPQLGSRFAALTPALEGMLKQLPARSPMAGQVREMLEELGGLPLEDGSAPVANALRGWLDKLQPKLGAQARASATATGSAAASSSGSPAAGSATAATPPAPTPPGPAQAPIDGEAADALLGLPLPEEPTEGKAPAPDTPHPKQPEPGKDEDPPPSRLTARPALTRPEGVSPSQRGNVTPGITKAAQPPLDFASRLDELGATVAKDHPAVAKLIHEAVAELRYTQLVNGPGPAGQQGQEYLVPLLVPQLSKDHPEGSIQVFQRAARRGEPLDPRNVRLVFVLQTEHMDTVQADMTIKEGQIELNLGVGDADDRVFLADHLDQLEQAINELGWDTGRFAARQARALPPQVRQQEGLSEVVRFDRRA